MIYSSARGSLTSTWTFTVPAAWTQLALTPEIVIGVSLGCLESCSFDLFHAIGVRFCKPEDAQGYGIVDVTPDF